jgi:hypothetical protein
MLGVGLISLAAQQTKTGARFLVFDCSAPDSAEAKFLEQVVAIIPQETKLVRPGDVEEVMTALAAEQQTRTEQPGKAPTGSSRVAISLGNISARSPKSTPATSANWALPGSRKFRRRMAFRRRP